MSSGIILPSYTKNEKNWNWNAPVKYMYKLARTRTRSPSYFHYYFSQFDLDYTYTLYIKSFHFSHGNVRFVISSTMAAVKNKKFNNLQTYSNKLNVWIGHDARSIAKGNAK